MPQNLVTDIGLAIVVATALAFLARLIRQPLLLAYVAAGVILGPTIGFRLITDEDSIRGIGSIGLILLLFMIGLEIDLKRLLRLGRAVMLTSAGGVAVSLVLSAGFFFILGYPLNGTQLDQLYLAAAVSVTSTMIVVKLLYDKRELGTLAGRLSLGITVSQDLWAILFIAVQPDLQNPELLNIIQSLGKGAGLIAASLLISRFVLPRLFHWAARQPELLLLGGVAWCFLVAGSAGAAGLSRETGALIAGISLSTFPYNQDLLNRLLSLRDFFVTLFFVSLGLVLPTPNYAIILLALITAGFVLVNRFATVFPFLYFMGHGVRVSWITSINLAHISEFSLVLVALGAASGHISPSTAAVAILAMIITAAMSTYLIGYSQQTYRFVEPILGRLGLQDRFQTLPPHDADHETGQPGAAPQKEIVLLGFYRIASSFLEQIEARHPEMLQDLMVIDFNPAVYRHLNKRNIACLYGDVSQMNFLKQAGVDRASLILSTIPDDILVGIDNLTLTRQLRQLAPAAEIVVTAEAIPAALEMYHAGADFVLLPRLVAATQLLEVLEDSRSVGLSALREEQLRLLGERREIVS